ncbi:hypothetical protein BC939DRAFT_465503 [Gamsiella multidivaricata]|uniref:uncharacterized protein n=1 Tax=Gamsiella multidivaricata TaxID=101098 RepID=UPI00221EE682|nr:uncharacterized protein BC939DRAFT_465503 [Gamsiella multidivaricata]KAI7817578.1 hypothetical protein BC939DRAFT_465503 [Gamsiella multidivaricata]
MALFLGRLTHDTRSRDLEDLFAKYGRVTRLDIKRGANSGFGFVEYEDPRDAEEAVHKLNGSVVNGNPIVVEFAKNNGRRAGDNECFKCGKEGHWARDCRGGSSGGRFSDRRRSRSPRRRSRSPRRDYRDRSRSRSPRRRDYRDDRRDSRDDRRDSRRDYRDEGRREDRSPERSSSRRDYDRQRDASPARGRSPSPNADRRQRSVSPVAKDRARSISPDGR